jgi:hypothetical protein
MQHEIRADSDQVGISVDRAAGRLNVRAAQQGRPCARYMALLHRKRNKPLRAAAFSRRSPALATPHPHSDWSVPARHPIWRRRVSQSRSSPARKGLYRMTTFDQRKDAFENKFAHDEELRFKATARRNKLLGLWAAEKLGKDGADADAYAKAVVVADFEEAGDDDVLRKVSGDFAAGGVSVGDDEIRRVMGELLIRAAEEIQAGR